MSATINTTNSLLDSHRVPRQVIVNHRIAELIVKTFGSYFSEQEHIQSIGISFIKFKSLTKLAASFILDATVNLSNTYAGILELFEEIRQRVSKRTEENDFVVFLLLLFLYDVEDAIKLGIVIRKIFGKSNDLLSFHAKFG